MVQDGARKSALLEDNNNLMSHYHSETHTLYQVFQRGLKVSGEHTHTHITQVRGGRDAKLTRKASSSC